jgi:heme-degrading monooxygenase HmoA
MKSAFLIGLVSFAQSQKNHSLTKSKKESKMDTSMKQIFIDKFLVPEKAIEEFKERTKLNMDFIRMQPGFIKEEAYERTDENANLVYITVVIWKNEDAIKKAKAVVQTEYKKQGFNPMEMMERLHITLDRGTYTEVEK